MAATHAVAPAGPMRRPRLTCGGCNLCCRRTRQRGRNLRRRCNPWGGRGPHAVAATYTAVAAHEVSVPHRRNPWPMRWPQPMERSQPTCGGRNPHGHRNPTAASPCGCCSPWSSRNPRGRRNPCGGRSPHAVDAVAVAHGDAGTFRVAAKLRPPQPKGHNPCGRHNPRSGRNPCGRFSPAAARAVAAAHGVVNAVAAARADAAAHIMTATHRVLDLDHQNLMLFKSPIFSDTPGQTIGVLQSAPLLPAWPDQRGPRRPTDASGRVCCGRRPPHAARLGTRTSLEVRWPSQPECCACDQTLRRGGGSRGVGPGRRPGPRARTRCM